MTAEQVAALRAEQAPAYQESPESRRRRLQRWVAIGVPALYLAALGTTVAAWGMPLARDQLFFWLGLGMAAFSVPAWRSWGSMLLEWLPFFGLLVAYDFLRGAVSVAPTAAHVSPQIDFDKALFGGHVPSAWLQQHLWNPQHLHVWDYAAWCVYMSHFFVVWIVAAVLWRTAHDRFRRYVAITVLLTLAAFVGYWLYPAQPPWLATSHAGLADVGRVVPQVWGHLGVPAMQSLYENGDLVNTVAAMPSLHAAYPFMLLLFFWPAGPRVRILLASYALAMAFTLVYGGEHFFADIVVGWAAALAVWALVTKIPWGHLRR